MQVCVGISANLSADRAIVACTRLGRFHRSTIAEFMDRPTELGALLEPRLIRALSSLGDIMRETTN